MDFSRLIQKYSRNFYLINKIDGHYDSQTGKWVEGQIEKVPVSGAVFPLTNEDLKFDEAGTYTTEDRKIYTFNKFQKGQEVEIDGDIFTVHQEKDYSYFEANGLRIYFIQRVGVASD